MRRFGLCFVFVLLATFGLRGTNARLVQGAGDDGTAVVTAALDGLYALGASETYSVEENERVGRLVKAATPVIMSRLAGRNTYDNQTNNAAFWLHDARSVLLGTAQMCVARTPSSAVHSARELMTILERDVRIGDVSNRYAAVAAYNVIAAINFVSAKRRHLLDDAKADMNRAQIARIEKDKQAAILQANYDLVGAIAFKTKSGSVVDTRSRDGGTSGGSDASSTEIALHVLRLLTAAGNREALDRVHGPGSIEEI